MNAALLRELASVAAYDGIDADDPGDALYLWNLHIEIQAKADELDPPQLLPASLESGVRLAG